MVQRRDSRLPPATRRVALAAGGLLCLTLLLFAVEWNTLASLETRTAYAVRQDLRRTAETAVQRMYAYLETQGVAAFGGLDHKTLHNRNPAALEATLRRALQSVESASSVFAEPFCACGDSPTALEFSREAPAPRPLTGDRLLRIREAARAARPLPFSNRSDIWIAPEGSGVLVFRSMPDVGPRSKAIGFEIPAAVWAGTVLQHAVATLARDPGQPELEFAIQPPGHSEHDATADFGPALGGARLSASYRGTTIAALARKQFWTHLGMIALVLGSIAFGLLFTVRGVRKESRAAGVKSAFLAHVSHEMKTPLATIRLYAETLEMGRIAEGSKRDLYLRRIREESERLAAMIGDVLEVSRMADGSKRFRTALRILSRSRNRRLASASSCPRSRCTSMRPPAFLRSSATATRFDGRWAICSAMP